MNIIEHWKVAGQFDDRAFMNLVNSDITYFEELVYDQGDNTCAAEKMIKETVIADGDNLAQSRRQNNPNSIHKFKDIIF